MVRVYKAIILNIQQKKMFHDFTNVRKYVGGPPNTLGMFKNTRDACQLSNSTDILFALSIITGKSQRTNHEYLPSS